MKYPSPFTTCGERSTLRKLQPGDRFTYRWEGSVNREHNYIYIGNRMSIICDKISHNVDISQPLDSEYFSDMYIISIDRPHSKMSFKYYQQGKKLTKIYPVKTPQQRQIEELEETINTAKMQIETIKGVVNH